jgi:patatin-like phospholipase/acyl hydrolase
LLERIEAQVGLLGRTNMLAGTSIGAINAVVLAAGHPPSTLTNLFRTKTAEIFAARDALDKAVGGVDEVFRANYSQDGLKRVLVPLLGDKTLGQLPKKVLIPTFDLKDERTGFWKPKMFHNFAGASLGTDSHEKAVDVVLRSAAAPTYFPSYQGYVDGGLVANNPTVCAIGKALKSGVMLSNMAVLSISTGFNPHAIEGQTHDYGYTQWAPKLLDAVFDGMLGVADYQARELLGPTRYFRLDPKLAKVVKLDDADEVPNLIAQADRVDLGPVTTWFRSL